MTRAGRPTGPSLSHLSMPDARIFFALRQIGMTKFGAIPFSLGLIVANGPADIPPIRPNGAAYSSPGQSNAAPRDLRPPITRAL